MMATGIQYLSREDYDAVDRKHWSVHIKEMLRSPAHCRHALDNEREDTAAFRRGRITHTACLELDKLRQEVAVWDGARRAGKAWEAFEEAHAHLEILTKKEMDQCLSLASAVRNHPIAAKYLTGGKSEVSILWDAHGHQLKGRVDYLIKARSIADLKTTKDASPDGFARESFRLGCHIQAAFYADGYAAATGTRLPYFIVAVEVAPPHPVAVYQVPEALLEIGRSEYLRALQRLAECEASGDWPGYPEVEHSLTAPRWAMPNDEDDGIEDMGLSFSKEAAQ
jgi:hypothetical protein